MGDPVQHRQGHAKRSTNVLGLSTVLEVSPYHELHRQADPDNVKIVFPNQV